MNREQIKERLYMLFMALQFDTYYRPFFTVGERIVINQERGKLMYMLDFPMVEPQPVPVAVETKIKEIDRLIQVYNWHPLNQTDFELDSI
jgi:hypothetical protein